MNTTLHEAAGVEISDEELRAILRESYGDAGLESYEKLMAARPPEEVHAALKSLVEDLKVQRDAAESGGQHAAS
ncbi:hypothetical protein [Streptomyces chartreusis]|uniref:hypothetical protein n=1 Tax=Streptomyces chartreusis TaxID=1969 RepID=UPI0034261E55